MVSHVQETGQVHTTKDHHQLRASLEKPSAQLALSRSPCCPDWRQRPLFPPSLWQRRHPGRRGRRHTCLVSSDCRKGAHLRGSSRPRQDPVSISLIPSQAQHDTNMSLPDSSVTPVPKSSASATPSSSKRPIGKRSSWTPAAQPPSSQAGSGATTPNTTPTRTTTTLSTA